MTATPGLRRTKPQNTLRHVARLLAIPELVRLLSSYLSPPTHLNLVQVNRRWNHLFVPELWYTFDDSLYLLGSKLRPRKPPHFCYPTITNLWELHTIRNWIRLIFNKYGHHIRVLKIRWDFVLEAANDAGPEYILENSEAVEVASRIRDNNEQNHSNRPKSLALRAPKVIKNLPADLGITTRDDSSRVETDWLMLQNIWSMVTLNPLLRRLIIKTSGVRLAQQEAAREYLDATIKRLKHLREFRATDFYGVDLLSKLKDIAPQIEAIWTSVSSNLEPELNVPLNQNITSLSVRNQLSSTGVLTLLQLHPNLERLFVYDMINDTTSAEVKSPVFTLKTLHIGNSRGSPRSMADPINILRHCPDLQEIGLLKVDAPALEAIMTHCRNVKVVKALYNPFFVNQRSQRRPIMETVNRFLMSYSTLRVFDAIELCVHVDDLLLQPWACDRLETFRCRIVGFTRLDAKQQAVYDRVSGPKHTAALTTAEAAIVRQFEQCRHQQQQVLDRLASLTSLKVLDLGYENRDPCAYQAQLYTSYDPEYPDSWSFPDGSKFYQYGGPIADTMELSLDSGLDRLAALKHLEIFGFEGTDHRIGHQELNWMAKQWPHLRVMRGLAKDRLLYLKYDTKKEALRNYVMSLRPDIEQSTLFKGFDE
ncbi:hypothetical protein BGZ70_009805 [Mortierella alpina]|uniref:F-box domain-containing protein n=1 Tax=Mortierella alpina TaxID=64518 RepID=A0A9P6J108_MORAP|nr:hypothetical protein BGZ70_009805 [Mortierella alpina]